VGTGPVSAGDAVRWIIGDTESGTGTAKSGQTDAARSGAVEAIAGGADAVGLSAKLANSIGRSNALHRTYAPVDIEAVRNTDEARLKGRRKMRAANGKRPKV
jgi:hypothetical protein